MESELVAFAAVKGFISRELITGVSVINLLAACLLLDSLLSCKYMSTLVSKANLLIVVCFVSKHQRIPINKISQIRNEGQVIHFVLVVTSPIKIK